MTLALGSLSGGCARAMEDPPEIPAAQATPVAELPPGSGDTGSAALVPPVASQVPPQTDPVRAEVAAAAPPPDHPAPLEASQDPGTTQRRAIVAAAAGDPLPLPPPPAPLAALAEAAAPAARTRPARAARRVAVRGGEARAACLAATRQAERAHRIPEGLMVAIALAESGLHAYAMNIGGRSLFPDTPEEARRLYAAAPRGAYLMAGCVQVNARVHARNSDWPLDPMRSADWGAAYLRSHYQRTGDWAEAVRRWNGGPMRNRLACAVRTKLAITNPGSNAMSGAQCGGSNVARDRSNGQALLEMAEAAAP
ncbi:transglycosylase SLT domain-containing protein [Muricoccus radiodurans]|uniref:transglycosylase SLT domain-containing protein n=1 Tax=Muricoccus radiodurans TaxID=2231721 RepID=UPI003CEB59AF